MHEPPAHPSPSQNVLLASLCPETCGELFPLLETVQLPHGKALYESGDVLTHIYFPGDAVISLLYVTENGASTEISIVGHEGLVGIPLITGGDSTPSRALVLNGGYAWRLGKQFTREAFNRHGDFRSALLRYLQVLMTQMAQTAVCNRYHSIQQQLCRWLLVSLDRIPGNQLTMTQEMIASLLGVRREGVTQAARKLQALGVIDYSRGKIEVRDRAQLEALGCECYGVIKKESERLLSPRSAASAG